MSTALALAAAPPADPSPVPPCVVHDRFGGYRATVSRHAIRRFADQAMRLEGTLVGLTDREAIEVLRGLGYPIDGIRDWLAFYGYPGTARRWTR